MTRYELNAYRISLRKQRAELLRGQRSHATANFDLDAKLLRDVRSALDRIEAGTFGICLECDCAVGGKRLAAVPSAAFCLVCQAAADGERAAPWKADEDSLAGAA